MTDKRDEREGGAAFQRAAVEEATLRDYFAAKALAGWIAGLPDEVLEEYDGDDRCFAEHQQAVAKTCYGYADAMLAQREKGGSRE